MERERQDDMKSNLLEAVRHNLCFPKLPLLETLVSKQPRSHYPFENTAVVSVQHLLETTGSLFEALFDLGLLPTNTFVLGKLYSTNPGVENELRSLGVHVLAPSSGFAWGAFSSQFRLDVAKLWDYAAATIPAGVRRILVLDDGGFALSTIPEHLKKRFEIAGVEQTTSGLTVNCDGFKCPVVEVASSAVKRVLEAPIIRAAVLRRVRETLQPSCSIGVVGLGSIGNAIAVHLIKEGFHVSGFDCRADVACDPRINVVSSLEELLVNANQVFGCAGADIFENDDCWRHTPDPPALYSCSSQDVEFRSVLRSLNRAGQFSDHQDRLADVHVPCDRGTLRIVKGGFPVNFDGTRESAPASEIQVTRALLLAGLLQARDLLSNPHGRRNEGLMLSPDVQQMIALEFLALQMPSSSLFTLSHANNFADVSWIESNSGGIPSSPICSH
jgi:hypothetical protein